MRTNILAFVTRSSLPISQPQLNISGFVVDRKLTRISKSDLDKTNNDGSMTFGNGPSKREEAKDSISQPNFCGKTSFRVCSQNDP